MKTRRQVNEASFRKVRRKQAQIRGAQPIRDRKYRQYVARFVCVVCFRSSWNEMLGRGEVWRMGREYNGYTKADAGTECAHVGSTGKGMRQKCSDEECAPLCVQHHREGKQALDKIGRKAFEAFHGVDLLQIAAALRKRFLEDQG